MKRLLKHFDRDAKDLLSSAGLAFVLRAAGAVLAFGFNVAVGQTLGATGAGLYFTALAVALNLSILARLGLDNALLRLVSAALAEESWARVNGLVRAGMIAAVLAGAVCSLAVILCAPLLGRVLLGGEEIVAVLRAMAFGIPTFAAMMLWGAVLKALRRVGAAMLVSGVIYPVLGLALIWPLTQAYGPAGAGLAYVAGTLGAALVGWWQWRRARTPAPAAGNVTAGLRASALPLLPMNLITQGVLPTAPLLMLSIWGSTEETGLFGAAVRIALLVSFFLISINTVVGPRLSALHTRGERGKLIREVRRSNALVLVLSSPFLLLLLLRAEWVMSLFGPEFTAGATALAIMACGQAVNAATGSVNLLLMMSGHERDARSTALIGGALIMVAGVVLIPSFGLIGAAISNAMAVATIHLTSLWFVWQRLHFLALPFGGQRGTN